MTGDDVRLFDAVLTNALGDRLEKLMTKAVAAAERGDWDRLRLIEGALREAVVLGTHAVVAAQSERENN